jgi:pimeloyl-ACP methyl ester carboxylesterase
MIYINNGKRIFYTDSTDGYPVVLLHGYLETSESWNGFKEKLAGFFRVITVDLPGHGLSDLIGDTQTMEEMAYAVKNLLDSLGISKFFLIGHSLGGYVALAFLERFQDSLSGYCLFHSHPFADSAEAVEKRVKEISLAQTGNKDRFYPGNVTRMFADQNILRMEKEVKRALDIASGISADTIIAVLKGMLKRPSRLLSVEEGKVPFLWILGKLDNYIVMDKMKGRVKMPGNAQTVVLSNSGHMGFIEEEYRSVEEVKNFILSIPECIKHHGKQGN